MAITSLPTQPVMSDAEWETRCDLAALYRIFHHLRMTDLIYTHMTARIPGEKDTFLINNYGDMFDEVTASSLVKMDFEGNVIGDQNSYNEAGFTIHSGVYKARPDVTCVAHTHTNAGVAISITKQGLLPISQDAAVVIDDVGYHDYGTPAGQAECDALGRSCKDINCVLLRNHGLLTLGASIPAALVEASAPGSARSSTVTAAPVWAIRHATAHPMTPPPTITTRACVGNSLCDIRGHPRVRVTFLVDRLSAQIYHRQS